MTNVTTTIRTAAAIVTTTIRTTVVRGATAVRTITSTLTTKGQQQ